MVEGIQVKLRCKLEGQPLMCDMYLCLVEGEQVKLRCKLEGQPLPQVTWHLNDVPIEQGDNYTVVSDFYEFILIIPRASLDMAGTYTITAKNQHGVDKMSTQLIVEGEFNAVSGIMARVARNNRI